MSKKPTPKKRQALSQTRSRYSTYTQEQRAKLEKGATLDKCNKCGKTKRRHFACEACGFYKDRQAYDPTSGSAPIQEIEA